MDPIHRVTGPPAVAARPARAAPAGFRLPSARADAAAPAGGVEEIGLPGMLLLQEQPDSADERAKKRGQELLATLAELQRALLAGDERHSPALAATLTTLAGDLPQASDPALRATVQAIALRARIEAMRLNPRPAG